MNSFGFFPRLKSFIISNYTGGGSEIWKMVSGVTQLRTVKDMTERGVTKPGKSGNILYGQPLTKSSISAKFKNSKSIGYSCYFV